MTKSQPNVPAEASGVSDTAATARRASAEARLQSGVRELSVPEPFAEAESMLLKFALALPVIGIVLMAIAWYAASGTAYVADQIPYVISGGFIGLGLVVVGVGLFVRYSLTRMFRFWLGRILIEQQVQTDRLIDAIEGSRKS